MEKSKNIIELINQRRRSMGSQKEIHRKWILRMLNSIDRQGFDLAFSSDDVILFTYDVDETLKITGRKEQIKKVEFFKKGKLILKFYVESNLSITSPQGNHYVPASLFENGGYDLFTKRFFRLYELVFAPINSVLIKPLSFFRFKIPLRKILMGLNAIARGEYNFKYDVGVWHQAEMYTAPNHIDVIYDNDTFIHHDQSVTIKYLNEEFLSITMGKDGQIKSLKDEESYLNEESLSYFKLSLNQFLSYRKNKEENENRRVQEKESLKQEIIERMNRLNGYQSNSFVSEVTTNPLVERELQFLQLLPRFPIKEGRVYLHQFIPIFNEIDADNEYLDIVDKHKYDRLKEVRLIELMRSFTALEENVQRNQFQSFMTTVKSMLSEAQSIQSKINDRKLYEFNKQVVLNLQT